MTYIWHALPWPTGRQFLLSCSMDQREILHKFLEEAQKKKANKEEFADEFLVSPTCDTLRGVTQTV